MNARSVRMTVPHSRRLLVALVASTLAACGGGGGTTAASSSVLPTQTQTLFSSGTLSAATGTMASGYVECDTQAHTAAGNNCDGFANFTPAPQAGGGGTFAFTAIAATASGTPIALQMSNGGALSYTNGSYRVIEAASDGSPIVTITGGPWSMPGAAFSATGVSYGNAFTVACVRVGTANLQLQLGSSAQPLPFATTAYASNITTVDCTAAESITFE